MIYFNNAATSYPKPQQVIDAVNSCLQNVPDAQFRNNANVRGIADRCRENLAGLFKIRTPKRIFFTSGATEAFNLIINGLDFTNKHIIATSTEHNSVLRPLMRFAAPQLLPETPITFTPCDNTGRISVSEIEKNIKPNTKAIFVNHCSNVTGTIQDIESIGKITHKRGILLIVDASQSAGLVEINVEKMNIDVLVFTGHKGLMGIQGTGGFYLRSGIAIKPTKVGGTGKDSQLIDLPTNYQEYEVGTQNISGITALNSGVEFILNTGIETIIEKEEKITAKLISGLLEIKRVKLYGDSINNRLPTISFNIDGITPADLGYVLRHSEDIIVRTGLHCAPLIHKALLTFSQGTVRASLSFFNTEQEIDKFLHVIKQISDSLKR